MLSQKLHLMIPLSENFIKSLDNLPGIDKEALLESLDTTPSVSIRYNRRKPHPSSFGLPDENMSPVEWCSDGRYLAERPVFTLDPALHAGAYYVQDASSMIYQQITERIVHRLNAEFGEKQLVVADFCASPGGKTTSIINAMPDGSIVVANEYVASRGKILRENLEKWGYPEIITTGSDSGQYARLPEIFDIIAVDAPCSGEGMMRKDEDARSQWSERLAAQCSALQKEILSDLSGCLRPGGYLIYSTCTFNLEEDEKNSLYISEKLGLEPVKIDSLELDGIDLPGRALLPGVEALRFMPHITRGEGLYISIFRKPTDANASKTEFDEFCDASHAEMLRPKSINKDKRKGKKGKESRNFETPAKELTESESRKLREWIRPDFEPRFELSGDMVTMMSENSGKIVDILRKSGVNVTGAGLPIATRHGSSAKTGQNSSVRDSRVAAAKKDSDIAPDSRLALNLALKPDAFPTASLSRDEALKYLRRELASLDENIPRGYVVVTYEGLPLGMMKNLGNRANNLYPLAWRIKMDLPR